MSQVARRKINRMARGYKRKGRLCVFYWDRPFSFRADYRALSQRSKPWGAPTAPTPLADLVRVRNEMLRRFALPFDDLLAMFNHAVSSHLDVVLQDTVALIAEGEPIAEIVYCRSGVEQQ